MRGATLGHPADGTLLDWSAVPEEDWDALLLGNGMSINISTEFAYASLFEEADKSTVNGSLTAQDRSIFEAFETTNFEVVLARLRASITLAETLGQDPEPYKRRFRTVQTALGTAVRGVHLERIEVSDMTLHRLKKELSRYGSIFSTSYDLLTYWAIGSGDDFGRFCDCFWSNSRNEFDPDRCDVWNGWTPVYYMHGALHLIVEGSGITRKLTRTHKTLLDQFGEPISGDPEARPLLISEGSARDKLRAINGNDYLAHVYETLQDNGEPLLVFGHSLGEQDQHLIDAINVNPDRPVAISMTKRGTKRTRREEQARIFGRLHTDPDKIYFYDAATHPLGSPKLTKKSPRLRFAPWKSATAAVRR